MAGSSQSLGKTSNLPRQNRTWGLIWCGCFPGGGLLGFVQTGHSMAHVCAQHTFITKRQKSNFYSFLLEANVCLWSLVLPKSEYLLSVVWEKRANG